MQFLARSLSKSIRPSLISSGRQPSWVLSQQCHSSFSATKSGAFTRGGGSKPEKSASVSPETVKEWPRPTDIPYQPKIANSVDLIGYVNQPVQFHANLDGSFWAGTVITHGSDSDSIHKFWIPVIFEGDLAHTANCHLKKNDRVYVTGHIFVDTSPVSGANPEQSYVQVMVRDLQYIQDSKALPKVSPASSNQKEGVLKHSASLQKGRGFRNDGWFDLIDKPDEWFDNRESKLNGSVHPKYPDFKKKDGSVALWLTTAPSEILSNLQDLKFDIPVRSHYPKQQKGEESWKDLVENIDKWYDNRLDKINEKRPDFKHKETGVGLWLDASPSWVIERLPPPKDQK
ncbi:unnamed protein product [Cochlearia groenlandica]